MTPSRPLLYDEVVEKFDLAVLKSPGDLVIKDGDFAVTKDGDLMLKNAEYSAMYKLVQTWRFNAPTLQFLFDSVFVTKRHREELDESLNQVFSDHDYSKSLVPKQESLDRYHELNDEIAANEFSRAAYAGAIVMVLSAMLLAFKDDIDVMRHDWENCGPLIGGCSIGAILSASANNFRHNDEWVKTRVPTGQQLASLKVLAAAFGETLSPDGSGHTFSRDICEETLELLSGGSFERLNVGIFAFANNIISMRFS